MNTYKPVKKKKSFWRNIFRLKYRFFALLVIIVISPLVYASDQNIPENVSIIGLGFEVTEENLLAQKLHRVSSIANLEDFPGGDSSSSQDGDNELEYDANGELITQKLRDANINTGFIGNRPFVDFGEENVISEEEKKAFEKSIEEGATVLEPRQKQLNDLIPKPDAPALKNFLIYPDYKIRAPVVYTTFGDLFDAKTDGSIDFTKPRDTSDINSPVQKKLEQGIVHLAYTPLPGEIGNSYIVGHSSNYSFIQSPYNTVFKPIQEKSKPGEIFFIYDNDGRELKFRVFEAKKIADSDVAEAYKSFPDQRVVTLQTSILGFRDGSWQATHRWLTRGELILE